MDVIILYLFLYFLTSLEPKMKSRCLYFACRLDNVKTEISYCHSEHQPVNPGSIYLKLRARTVKTKYYLSLE